MPSFDVQASFRKSLKYSGYVMHMILSCGAENEQIIDERSDKVRHGSGGRSAQVSSKQIFAFGQGLSDVT